VKIFCALIVIDDDDSIGLSSAICYYLNNRFDYSQSSPIVNTRGRTYHLKWTRGHLWRLLFWNIADVGESILHSHVVAQTCGLFFFLRFQPKRAMSSDVFFYSSLYYYYYYYFTSPLAGILCSCVAKIDKEIDN
jgi:hypothetical protein